VEHEERRMDTMPIAVNHASTASVDVSNTFFMILVF
jgi:hypothetical protein